jgi:hypothetical protein
MKKNYELDKLVKTLFTNYCGEEADRLVLMSKDNRDLGAWCKEAIRDRIRATLAKKYTGPNRTR